MLSNQFASNIVPAQRSAIATNTPMNPTAAAHQSQTEPEQILEEFVESSGRSHSLVSPVLYRAQSSVILPKTSVIG